jgi:hypothetical protein
MCRAHDEDLTQAVLAKVDNDRGVIANLAHRPGRQGVVTVGSFTVDVSCPGGDLPHQLRFMGTFEG